MALLLIASCSNDDDNNTANHCNNGVLDGDETAIDCGGSCEPCNLGDITSYYIKGSIGGTSFDFQQIVGNSQLYAFGAGSALPGLCSSSTEDGIAEAQFISITSFANLFNDITTFLIGFNVDFGSNYYNYGVEEKLDYIFSSLTLNSSYSYSALSTNCYELEIVYTDDTGKEWSTLNGNQPSTSNFIVTDKIPFTGFPRLNSGVIKFTFNCALFDEDGNSLNITNGEGLSLYGNFN